MSEQTELRRSLSLPLITLYGLGTIIGAGIYVLIGEVAGVAGNYMPLSFLVAALLVTFTAFAYAELSARYPRSAGEAVYIQAAFSHKYVSLLVALLIICIGVVSSATLARGVVGYLQLFTNMPSWLVISAIVFMLGAIAAWGVRESVAAAAVLTLVEIAGLFIVLWVARAHFGELPERWDSLLPGYSASAWQAILLGSFVAFYAFVGFEDMVNVVEEVKQPRKNLPRAIFITLVVTTLIYFAVALAAALTVPISDLASSTAPLAEVYARVTGEEAFFIALVGVVSVINGILVQIIMASRILYGSARQGWLPSHLGEVNVRTRTPLLATAIITGAIWVMAMWLPLLMLAQITSFITLFIFSFINLALVVIKRREPMVEGVHVYPIIIPICGLVFTSSLLLFQLYHWLGY